MRLLIHKNYDNACLWAANHIIQRINDHQTNESKAFVLGLPTGSSPLGIYRRLISANRAEEFSFADVITYNMDEYLGLAPNHPLSYRQFMYENLFNHIDISAANIHLLDGMVADPQAECDAYEASIKAAGGVELFLGGIGNNGHIAFNEPGSSLNSRTRVVALTSDTRKVNARFFDGDMHKVPEQALSVGIGTIMDAREVLIIVSGKQKAHALATAVEGGISQSCPLSCLQNHPKAIIVCDEEAAEDLRHGTVKYFKDIEGL